MRITKEWLRAQKEALQRRVKDLLTMSEGQALVEFCILLPHVDADASGIVNYQDVINALIQYAIEKALPSHRLD